jgi:hypothetical protein
MNLTNEHLQNLGANHQYTRKSKARQFRHNRFVRFDISPIGIRRLGTFTTSL